MLLPYHLSNAFAKSVLRWNEKIVTIIQLPAHTKCVSKSRSRSTFRKKASKMRIYVCLHYYAPLFVCLCLCCCIDGTESQSDKQKKNTDENEEKAATLMGNSQRLSSFSFVVDFFVIQLNAEINGNGTHTHSHTNTLTHTHTRDTASV